MDPARWQRIQDHLAELLELPSDDRAAALAALEREDPELAAEVAELLRHEPAEGWLEPKVAAEPARTALAEELAPGSRLGPLRVVRRLGAGGVGAVYLAERVDGAFEAQVAVKVVKRGMDSAAILERFQRERQVLADLSHPGIARLLDGGNTDDGRPYLVMEHVDGTPIDAYCRERALDLHARIALVRRLCGAVEHAHARGVMHRDIKPRNILVTAEGEPKLLDFGLAKVLDPFGSDGDFDRTATQERILTPQYASPEQVQGLRVGPATDVYSLGVVLYELLVGRRPYDLETASWAEIERVVCTRDPEPPSRVLQRTGGGETTGVRPDAWDADLDNILLMALRKEPERRYPSVALLESDLGRFVEGRPVRARPDTLGYRVSKFVRRNRTAVYSAGGVLFLVLAGVAYTRGVHRDKAELGSLADERGAEVVDLSRAMLYDVQVALRDLPGGLEIRRRVVEEAAQKLATLADGSSDPHLQVDLAQAYLWLGDALGEPGGPNLGRTGEAEASYRRALDLLEALPTAIAETHGAVVLADEAHLRLAKLAASGGRSDDAERMARELLDDLRQRDPDAPGSEHVETMLSAVVDELGATLTTRLDFAGARELLVEHEARVRARYTSDPSPANRNVLASALVTLGDHLQRAGRFDEALPHLREGVALREKIHAATGQGLLGLLDARAILAFTVGWAPGLDPEARRAEADALFAELRAAHAAHVAEDPQDVRRLSGQQRTLFYEGRHYEREHRVEEEAEAFALCAEVRRKIAERDPDGLGNRIHLAEVQDMLAWAWIRLDRPADAVAPLEESHAAFEAALAADPGSGHRRRALAVNAYYLAIAYGNKVGDDDPRESQVADWRAAREHFVRSGELLRELEAEDGLTESDRSMIATMDQGAELCTTKLEELGADD